MQYLLVVATPFEALAFAVSFDDIPLAAPGGGQAADATDATPGRRSPGAAAGLRNGGLGSVHGRLQLDTTEVRVSTDDFRVTKIVGTSEGRILLGSDAGAIHELVYDAPGASGSDGAGGSGVAALGAAVARVAIEGAAGAVSRALGITALLPSAKRARRIDHGTPSRLGSVLKSLTGGLFSSPAYPITDLAVDHHRRLLYSLASNGEIRVYGLGPSPVTAAAGVAIGGMGAGPYAHGGYSAASGAASIAPGAVLPPTTALPHLATLLDPEASCRAYASDARTSSLNKPRPDVFRPDLADRLLRGGGGAGAAGAQTGLAWPLVSLHVLPPSQSSLVHLVALAQSGARLYFTTHSLGRYLQLSGAGGAAAPAPFALPGYGLVPAPTDSSVHLTLVYVRMPPPAVTSESYTSGEYAQYVPDGFAPSEDVGTLAQAHNAFVSGDIALVPKGGASPSAGAGGGVGLGREHLVAIVRDPLVHWKAPGASSVGGPSARFNESVQDIQLDGTVHAIGAVLHPSAPTLACDGVFTECGALALPEGETAPLPALALRDICSGAGVTVPDAAMVAGAGSSSATATGPLAGAKRPLSSISGGVASGFFSTLGLGGGGAASSISASASAQPNPALAALASSPALPSALVLQSGLLDSGVPLRFHHMVRRRLWGEAPAAGELSTPFSAQHDAPSSMSGFVVLTTFGVYKLARTRPIDQMSRLLRQAVAPTAGAAAAGGADGMRGTAFGAALGRTGAFGASAAGGGDLHATLALSGSLPPASSPALAGLFRFFVWDEVLAMAVVLSLGTCGDVWSQGGAVGRAPISPLKGGRRPMASPGAPLQQQLPFGSPGATTAPTAAAAIVGSLPLGAVPPAVSRAAGALFDSRGGLPSWHPTTHEYRVEDLRFSGRFNGLLHTLSRLLRPLWGASVFMTPPVASARGGAAPGARPACLLPRFTPAELRPLHKALVALGAFTASHFSFCGWGDKPLLDLARDTGLVGRLGLSLPGGPLHAGSTVNLGSNGAGNGADGDAFMIPSTPDDRRKRANALEMVYVILVHRLVTRAAEAVALLAAVAEPAHGALPILASLAAGKPAGSALAAPGAATATTDDALFSLIAGPGRLTFAQLVTSADGLALSDGLTTRMLQGLRAIAPSIASTGATAAGGSGGGANAFANLPGFMPLPTGGQSGAGAPNGAAALVSDAASSLASYLRSHCPSFFSESHHALLVAERSLDGARAAVSSVDRLRLLEASLREAGRAVTCGDSDSIASSLPRLGQLCAGYRSLEFYTGVIGLALAGGDRLARLAGVPLEALPADAPFLAGAAADAAQDAGAVAPGSAAGNSSAPHTAALRLQLYSLITDMLDAVRRGTAAGGASPAAGDAADQAEHTVFAGSSSSAAGATTRAAAGGTTVGAVAGSESTFRSLLAEVLRSGDALFHSALYGWLVSSGAGHEVLPSLSTPFVESFLTGAVPVAQPGGGPIVAAASGSAPDPDLLFAWLMAHRRFREAALLQRSLADREGAGHAEPLSSRIERLTLAIAIAREPAVRLGAGAGAQATGLGAFGASGRGLGSLSGADAAAAAPLIPLSEVADWEASLAVLRLQEEVKGVLARAADVASESGNGLASAEYASAVSELEYGRLSLLELYRHYAGRFGLHEACLAILNTARQAEHGPLVGEHWLGIVTERLTSVAEGQGGGEDANSSGPASAIASLSQTLADLGRRFVPPGTTAASPAAPEYFAFPLGFLCELLEGHALSDGWRGAMGGGGEDGSTSGGEEQYPSGERSGAEADFHELYASTTICPFLIRSLYPPHVFLSPALLHPCRLAGRRRSQRGAHTVARAVGRLHLPRLQVPAAGARGGPRGGLPFHPSYRCPGAGVGCVCSRRGLCATRRGGRRRVPAGSRSRRVLGLLFLVVNARFPGPSR